MRKLPTLCVFAVAVLSAAQAPANRASFAQRLSDAALDRTTSIVRYDPKYVRITYPGGDVPADTGVCTDEIIRVYRKLGIDLQKEVHEDILAHPEAYPGARKPADSNIDHRRVPNLARFFKRRGASLPLTTNAADYRPGDIVTWDLGGGVNHIGMVVDRHPLLSTRPMIVHNIGAGPRLEDVLFSWRITGHYRYYGEVETR